MIFADTSFFVAISLTSDAHHGPAVDLLQAHARSHVVTTNDVRGETWTAVQRRSGHHVAVRFLDRLAVSPRMRVAVVDPEIEEEALRWLRRHDEREYSFVDATSFAFMRANRITDALAFDGDFAAAGFRELRP